jgi:hypothetical protein
MEFKDRLAAYFAEQALWRDHKAEEYPDDVRNERYADGLRALAEHVRKLPATDERLTLLAILDPLDVDDIAPFMPGEEGGRLASQFRFHDPNEDMDTFLEAFIAACARDREDSVEDLE